MPEAQGVLDAPSEPSIRRQTGRNLRKLQDLLLGHHRRGMAGNHVRDLVRHHSGQFRFVFRCQDQPFVDVEIAAREGKRIHLIGIDDLDVERNLGIRMLHDVLADAIDIFADHGIFDQLGGLFEFRRDLLSDLYLPFQGNKVREDAPDPCGDAPIADILNISMPPGGGKTGNRHSQDHE